ncbi:retrovirus-related pol polyprotein from transposon TNT 1-94 [Tanacetum coccineum]
MVTVRCLLNIDVSQSWPIFQLDVNNAFLYCDLDEVVYMRPPEEYFPLDNKVCRLKKSLYGLKQAPRQWNYKLTSTLTENGFSQSKSDYSLFTKSNKGVFLALLVYVDDIIITSNNLSKIETFKVFLKYKFMIKDLGKLKYFLGIEVIDTDKDICLNQRKYVLDLLSEYSMLACKPVNIPLLSKLVISNEATKSDHVLDNITDYQNQFMHSPLKSHLKTAFKILRYLKGCPGLGIHFVKTSGMFLNAFSDADWAKCVITRKSVIEHKNDNEALKDESWAVAMQEELNQFVANDVWELVPLPFEMSMMGELNFFLGLQIKQMEDGIFFNQSKYIKEMLKKFGLEDSKPTKTPMSTEIKLTKDDEADSVDSSKYRGMIGSLLYLTASRPDIMFSVCLCARFQENPKTTHLEAVKRIFRYIRGTSHLGLWCPKGTGIETVIYADSDHAGDYVDRKSTSGVCTFMGCCLTSWIAKKQTALAISTTEVEYVSAGKACQQALWMKQALIDYGIRIDDVSIMCDSKGAINLSKTPYNTLELNI